MPAIRLLPDLRSLSREMSAALSLFQVSRGLDEEIARFHRQSLCPFARQPSFSRPSCNTLKSNDIYRILATPFLLPEAASASDFQKHGLGADWSIRQKGCPAAGEDCDGGENLLRGRHARGAVWGAGMGRDPDHHR